MFAVGVDSRHSAEIFNVPQIGCDLMSKNSSKHIPTEKRAAELLCLRKTFSNMGYLNKLMNFSQKTLDKKKHWKVEFPATPRQKWYFSPACIYVGHVDFFSSRSTIQQTNMLIVHHSSNFRTCMSSGSNFKKFYKRFYKCYAMQKKSYT